MGRIVMAAGIWTGPGNIHAGRANAGNGIHAGYRGTVARMLPGFDSRALRFGHGGCWIVSNNHFIGHVVNGLSSMADFIFNSKEFRNVNCCGSSRKS